MSLALFRYRLACSGAADTDITDVATATAISSTAAEEIIVNLLSVLTPQVWQTLRREIQNMPARATQLDKFLSLLSCVKSARLIQLSSPSFVLRRPLWMESHTGMINATKKAKQPPRDAYKTQWF